MKALYGRGPLHLVGHVLCFALAGYAILQILGIGNAGRVIVWLIGAVLVHDLVLWPLYTTADRAGASAAGPWVNFVRVPVGLSLAVLLVFFPVIAEKGEGSYARVAGREWSGHVTRWLVLTAILFAVSGALYLLRRRSGGSKS